MRVAAIYDIHANLPALQAVLEEIRQARVDYIVVGGDVLPGPMPRETIACLREVGIPVQFILGNGDREVLARMKRAETEWYRSAAERWRAPVRWCAEQLRAEDEKLLASWPATARLHIQGLGEVVFCHGTPRSDTEIFTRLTPEERLLPIFDDVKVSTVICGHTHMRCDRMIGRVRVVNAGSVGMPFGEPGAYWLLLGPEVESRHTSYDLGNAAELIRATKYPQAEDFATRNVLRPPSEKEMLEVFSRAELK
ncbi:MAG: metallophosphoesterase family protein [Candidatus Acidiferrales bacterium]